MNVQKMSVNINVLRYFRRLLKDGFAYSINLFNRFARVFLAQIHVFKCVNISQF
jgi:hypothetical protein